MMKTLIAIVVGILVLGGGYFLLSGKVLAPSPSAAPSQTAPETPSASASRTVTYTPDGFAPSSLTIQKGETVTFINQSGQTMWVASAMHPTHSVYSGTTLSEHCGGPNEGVSFDQCEEGVSYSFTFQKSGTWKYHNHIRADNTGTIVVQ